MATDSLLLMPVGFEDFWFRRNELDLHFTVYAFVVCIIDARKFDYS